MQLMQDTLTPLPFNKLVHLSPRNGARLTPVSATLLTQIPEIVQRARQAQHTWARLSPRERGARVKPIAKLLLARADHLARLMLDEQGKALTESYMSDILPSADLFSYWSKTGQQLLRPEVKHLNPIQFPNKVGSTSLRPKGVVGIIAPWNYPLALPLRSIVPALMAGNAVVLKPSEFAPRIGLEVARLFDDLGIPNLVSVVNGDAEAGAALIEANVDHIVFTGSVNSGKRVAQACAARLIPYSLELGGKDAAIVLDDADLERAADGIVWGAFTNAGQNCASIERVYIQESIAERFTQAVLTRTAKLTLGNGENEVFDIGPLVRRAGLDTVRRHVVDAVNRGAVLLCGGEATGIGQHFPPTVLGNVKESMQVMHDETFGPLLPIVVVKNAQEALEKVNHSAYALTTSIWSKNLERARALAREVNTGVVTINNHSFTAVLPHAPWHGPRLSGNGTTGSRYGFYDFCQPHYELVDHSSAPDIWWFPHTPALLKIGRALSVLRGGGKHFTSALLSLIWTFRKRWH